VWIFRLGLIINLDGFLQMEIKMQQELPQLPNSVVEQIRLTFNLKNSNKATNGNPVTPEETTHYLRLWASGLKISEIAHTHNIEKRRVSNAFYRLIDLSEVRKMRFNK